MSVIRGERATAGTTLVLLDRDIAEEYERRHENDAANSDAPDHQAGNDTKQRDPEQLRYRHGVPQPSTDARFVLRRAILLRRSKNEGYHLLDVA